MSPAINAVQCNTCRSGKLSLCVCVAFMRANNNSQNALNCSSILPAACLSVRSSMRHIQVASFFGLSIRIIRRTGLHAQIVSEFRVCSVGWREMTISYEFEEIKAFLKSILKRNLYELFVEISFHRHDVQKIGCRTADACGALCELMS